LHGTDGIKRAAIHNAAHPGVQRNGGAVDPEQFEMGKSQLFESVVRNESLPVKLTVRKGKKQGKEHKDQGQPESSVVEKALD
jgi:hypothetical protein